MKKLGLIISVVFFIGLMGIGVYAIIDESKPRDYYLKNLEVVPTTIAEEALDGNKPYVRVNISKTGASSDDFWIEVDNNFYNNHFRGDQVGVLLANFDVYKVKKSGGKTVARKYEKDGWGIEEIYDSYDAAVKANPTKKWTMMTIVKGKKTTQKGSNYLELDAEGKKVKTLVDKGIYDKYQVGDKIETEFESIGDYVSFKGIK